MKTVLFTCSLLLLFSVSTLAQTDANSGSWLLRAGGGFGPSFTENPDFATFNPDNDEHRKVFLPSIRAEAGYQLNDQFSVFSGLNFSQKGFSYRRIMELFLVYPTPAGRYQFDQFFRFTYLEVPLTIAWKPVQRDYLPALEVGASAGYLLYAKRAWKGKLLEGSTGDPTLDNPSDGKRDEEYTRDTEVSVLARLHWTIPLSDQFVISPYVQVQHGLTKIYDPPSDVPIQPDARHRTANAGAMLVMSL